MAASALVVSAKPSLAGASRSMPVAAPGAGAGWNPGDPLSGRFRISAFADGPTYAHPFINSSISVVGNSTAAGAKIHLWQTKLTGGQKWDIQPSGSYFKIVNAGSQKALEVPSSPGVDGEQLQQNTIATTDRQLWSINYLAFGLYEIVSKANPTFKITRHQGGTADGTQITQALSRPGDQYWYFYKLHAPELPPVDNSTPTGTTISWEATDTLLSHSVYTARYARMHRVNANTILLTYLCTNWLEPFNRIAIRRSTDNGATWGAPTFLESTDDARLKGPDFLTLADGSVLLAYPTVSAADDGTPADNERDYVKVVKSTDAGLTWSAPTNVARGRSWEPVLIQLANGEIELFYASEAFWYGTQPVLQEIRMARSTNGGANWYPSERVAFNPDKRDGMPAPLRLANGKGIIFAIESVGDARMPWMLWSSEDASWTYEDGIGTVTNGRRWTTTDGASGAPYLVQLPTGETVLSCQNRAGRAVTDWHKDVMLVAIGNSVGKNFTNYSYPWPVNVPLDEGYVESSIFLKDANTIVAVSTHHRPNNTSEIRVKTGHIVRT
jgi:hypothetical protein